MKYQDAQKHGGYAPKPKISKFDYVYNGQLSFSVNRGKSISDNKSGTLEEKLSNIMIELYEASDVLRKEREAREEAERKRQEETRRENRRKRYNVEVQRTNALINAAEDFDVACKIRAFVAAVEASGELDEDKQAWVNWAKQKADWHDPTVAREDECFGKRKHGADANAKILKESYSSWGW